MALPTSSLPPELLTACPQAPAPPGQDGARSAAPAPDAIDAGMFRVPDSGFTSDCPLHVVNRADRAFVRLTLSGASTLAGRSFAIHTGWAQQTHSLSIPSTLLSIEITRSTAYGGTGAEVIVMARAHDGQRHRVVVASDGSLWVSREPLAPHTVVETITGEQLDTASMTRLGRIHERTGVYGLFFLTQCAGMEACQVSVHPSRLVAPAAGTLRCIEEGVRELESGEIKLQLRVAGAAPASVAPAACEPGEVSAGQPIEPNTYLVVTATDLNGRTLSVVVAEDGTLYAGEVRPPPACPCLASH
jgi:hypothetical protein